MKKRYFLPLRQAACFILISLLLQNCSGSHNLPIEEEELTETIEEIEGQVSIIGREEEQEDNTLPAIMPELWQEIFSYLDFKEVLAARAVSVNWNKHITGFKEVGIVGVESRPQHIINTPNWLKREEINFRNMELHNNLTFSTFANFIFLLLDRAC